MGIPMESLMAAISPELRGQIVAEAEEDAHLENLEYDMSRLERQHRWDKQDIGACFRTIDRAKNEQAPFAFCGLDVIEAAIKQQHEKIEIIRHKIAKRKPAIKKLAKKIKDLRS